MALPRKNRISPEGDYQRVFKEGKTVKNSFFFMKYLPNRLGRNRWGVSVPVKICKKAVDRNRTKRKILEAVKEIKNFSLDAIIIASGTILDKSFNEIKGQLDQVIKKISVNN